MSVLKKMSQTFDLIKNFDDEKSIVTIESDKHIVIEAYKSIRFFTDAEIEIEFEDFAVNIKGKNLVINEFNPGIIKMSGVLTEVEYIRECNRGKSIEV